MHISDVDAGPGSYIDNIYLYIRLCVVTVTRLQVNSPQRRGGYLRAVIRNPKVPTRLAVGPRFLSPTYYGDYWFVAGTL